MRSLISAVALLSILSASAREVRDTVLTRQNDKIILTYNVSSDNGRMVIDFPTPPRIIPSSTSELYKACKGEIDRLKVVVFDREGVSDKTTWSGISPKAFMVPSGMSHDESADGYFILGESEPIEFRKQTDARVNVKLPLYIAVYNKKRNFLIAAVGEAPLSVASPATAPARTRQREETRRGVETERIAVTSSVELEADNAAITSALGSIDMIKELLERETEVPFSQMLQSEINSLHSLKNQIRDRDVLNKINDVLFLCSDKERDLKDAQNQSALAAKAQEQALIQQQKQEAETQQKAAEEKAREQEKKQQKRTMWMIISGVILAILGFIGNAVFKHFRDLRNQKSIMQMQESLARQAQHEAGRRTREIIRNKAHQAANKGRNKLRNTMNNRTVSNGTKKTNNNKPRSI